VRRRQHLVPGLEPQRADDGVQAGGRVRDEDEIVRPRTHERGERRTRLGHPPRPLDLAPEPACHLAREEVRRPRLERALEALVLLEDRDRTGAEAPVIQVRDLRVEQEAVAHG
jgi:hypothetical protein